MKKKRKKTKIIFPHFFSKLPKSNNSSSGGGSGKNANPVRCSSSKPSPHHPHPCSPQAVQPLVEKLCIQTGPVMRPSIRSTVFLSRCLVQCIHWSIIMDVSTQSLLLLSPPPHSCRTTPVYPGSAVGSLLIKLTQVKVRMVFDMKCMKLTGKHIAPHFYHTESVVSPAPLYPPI